MPYTHLSYGHIQDRRTRELFQRASDLLADVYTMLSSRPLERTKGGGCNLAATLVLLCIVDAVATHIYGWPIVSVFSDAKGTRYKVTVVALYWAVKRMVADLAATT